MENRPDARIYHLRSHDFGEKDKPDIYCQQCTIFWMAFDNLGDKRCMFMEFINASIISFFFLEIILFFCISSLKWTIGYSWNYAIPLMHFFSLFHLFWCIHDKHTPSATDYDSVFFCSSSHHFDIRSIVTKIHEWLNS